MTGPDLVHQLRTLAELHSGGAITAEEFTRAKARLLSHGTAEPEADKYPPDQRRREWFPPADPPIHAREPRTDLAAPVQQSSARGPGGPALPAPPAASWQPTAQALPPFGRGIPSTPTRGSRPVGSARPRRPKAYVVTGGGLLTLLAFFAMPLASIPIVGSLTGANVAGLSSEVGALGMLWLVPFAAAVITALGAWQSLTEAPASDVYRRVSVFVILAASVGVLVYVVTLIAVQSQLSQSGASRFGISATSFMGAGFWIALLALGATGVVAMIGRELSSSNGPTGVATF